MNGHGDSNGDGNGNGRFSGVEWDYIRRHHRHEPADNQCSSALVKHIKAPVHLVWSLVRRFDQPQKYKPFVSRALHDPIGRTTIVRNFQLWKRSKRNRMARGLGQSGLGLGALKNYSSMPGLTFSKDSPNPLTVLRFQS